MKKLLYLILCFALVFLISQEGEDLNTTSDNSETTSDNSDQPGCQDGGECFVNFNCCDKLLKKYDASSNIFDETKYSKSELLYLFNDWDPLSLRKEEGVWYLYHFYALAFYSGERLKLYRIPLDHIYGKDFTISEKHEKFFNQLNKRSPYYVSQNKMKKVEVRDIYTIDADYGYKDSSGEYEWHNFRLSKEFDIDEFNFSVSGDKIYVDGIFYNTKDYSIHNIEIKIKIYTSPTTDGDLITEDIYVVKDTIESKSMILSKLEQFNNMTPHDSEYNKMRKYTHNQNNKKS